jgi:MFS family permease
MGDDGGATTDASRRRSATLAVTMVGIAAVSFPNTLATAVLPQMRQDLDVSTSLAAWVSIAPAIAFAVSMPLFGKLGDLYGHRRVFIYGFAVSTVFALATAAAPDIWWLIVLRTVSAIAGTSTVPTSYAMLALVYPPAERAKAIGRLTTVLAASPVVGIVIGAPLADAVGWRIVFLGQAIPSAIAVIAAIPLLPDTAGRRDVRFDIPGALALGVGMVGLLFAVNRVDDWGFDHPWVIGPAVIGVAGLAVLLVVERRSSAPLFPLELFARRDFTTPIVTMGLTQAAFVGATPVIAFLLRDVFAYSTLWVAFISGLRPASFAVAASIADRSVRRVGGRSVQGAANTLLVVSGVLGAVGAWQRSVPLAIACTAIGGFSVGLARPGVVTAVNNAVEEGDVGLANGVNNMAAQIGGGVGQTVLLAVAAASTPGAYAWSFLTMSAIGCVALVSGQLIRHPPPQRTPRPVAA